MRKTKEQKGITLVALIITIIVLLILAAVAISAVQDGGIVDKAKQARDNYAKAQGEENTLLQEYLNKIEENSSGGNSGNGGSGVNLVPTTTVLEAQGKVLSTDLNTVAADEYGNIIVVPAGFKITTDASKVTEGIVIEDCTEAATAGSQFVWVPVGTIYTNKEKTEYKTIKLGRYSFDSSGVASAYSGSDYTENTSSKYGEAVAKDINGFISSATTKGGYYIGRYEAGNSNNTLVCKANQTVYNNVSQPEASSFSKSMYTSSNFTSDLINSYAWDTAIVFIQTFSNDSNYANSNYSTSFANTGINPDKYCNIYDMSGNAMEWTTETYSYEYGSCVPRGGYCYNDNACGFASGRGSLYSTPWTYSYGSFRPLLYVAL